MQNKYIGFRGSTSIRLKEVNKKKRYLDYVVVEIALDAPLFHR